MEMIQLCFRIKDENHNKEVRDSITKIKNDLDKEIGQGKYKILSCHLNKEVVKSKGFDPTMINFLYDTFGEDYINMCDAKTFEEAIRKMNIFRQATATNVDRLYVVKEEIGNVAYELELFTNKRVRVY